MRADRLLSIILLLQTRGRMTARTLADELEVSERTIHRDMEALSLSGIPVIAERGIGGGWSLLGEYRTSLTGLSEAEVQSLFVTRPTRLLADLNMEKAADGALLKLLAAMPSTYRERAEYARQRLHIDVSGWQKSDESAPLLHVLQEAVWQESKIKFAYGRDNCAVERTADPLGLVAKGSVWYLVAGVDGEIRSYRVSRIESVDVLSEHADRPPDFDLGAFWRESSRRFQAALPEYVVRARVRTEIIPRLTYAGRFARIQQIGEVSSDGWAEAVIRFDVEEMAMEYALSFGTNLEVLEPVDLRKRVSKMAAATIAMYQVRNS
jgi:predicted DNA-binding transcriptional regulator YafY